MTASIVNLNKARKAKSRMEKVEQAQGNRAKFGQSKAARDKEILAQSQRDKLLDGAKRDSAGDNKKAANDERGDPGKTT